jgi:hypothetical protein
MKKGYTRPKPDSDQPQFYQEINGENVAIAWKPGENEKLAR